jgi:hypothetical protein
MGNQWWNLEWATQSENIKHSYATNANRKSNASKVSKRVRCRRDEDGDAADWRVYDSASEAARTLGLHATNIRECCRANAPSSA